MCLTFLLFPVPHCRIWPLKLFSCVFFSKGLCAYCRTAKALSAHWACTWIRMSVFIGRQSGTSPFFGHYSWGSGFVWFFIHVRRDEFLNYRDSYKNMDVGLQITRDIRFQKCKLKKTHRILHINDNSPPLKGHKIWNKFYPPPLFLQL